MGYRILYEPVHDNRYPPKKDNKKASGVFYAVVLFLLIVMLAANPKIQKTLKYFLIPGDPVRTEQAAVELVEDLRSGVNFQDAVTTFCMEILDGAEA